MKRKRITPLQRARQAANRVNALQAVASYGRKIGAKRAASVKAALNELRRRGVARLKVLWSREEPLTPLPAEEETERRALPGSTAFVPPAGGLLIAAEVVKDLTGGRAAR
jgi:tRNA A37 threonylcarbamoyladenosine dehydratase